MLRRLQKLATAAALFALSGDFLRCTPTVPEDQDIAYGAAIAGILWLGSQTSPCEVNPTNLIATGVLWSSADPGSLLLNFASGRVAAFVRTEGDGPFTVQMFTNPGISGVLSAYDRGRSFATANGEDPMLSGLQSPMSYLCLAASTTPPNEHFQIQIN
ncbi:MAG: hypothetical protein K1X75_06130 [Leptospirales bacterium]|nr:hypothetical protein [Leptospirales bacterium]